MTIAYLLDTNALSAAVSQKPDSRIVARLKRHEGECAIPAPVWHELVYGVRRLPAGKRREALEHYLVEVVKTVFPILPYDESAAAWHAQERARLEQIGKPAPFVDGQIAAIAHLADATLVTRNTKDFGRFRLRVTDWSQPRKQR